jgi:hypothetical protein
MSQVSAECETVAAYSPFGFCAAGSADLIRRSVPLSGAIYFTRTWIVTVTRPVLFDLRQYIVGQNFPSARARRACCSLCW